MVTVNFHVEVFKESNGVAEPVDTRAMSTMIGVAATYTSGVKIAGKSAKDAPRFVGLGISLTPEKTSGELVTVRSELSGADFVDPARTQLIPIRLLDIRTVTSGTRFDLIVNLAAPAEPSDPLSQHAETPKPLVTYRVAITPRVL